MGTRPRPCNSPRQAAAAAAGGRGSSRRGRGMGGLNGPQTDADVLRHPRRSATAERQSDDTTANQTTTSHRRYGRAGRENHDGKANEVEGSPRLQPPPTYARWRCTEAAHNICPSSGGGHPKGGSQEVRLSCGVIPKSVLR